MRPLVEKLCPSMLKYLPGYSKPTEGEEPSGKCPLSKTDQTQSSDKNSTETKTEVTAGDGGSKKTN